MSLRNVPEVLDTLLTILYSKLAMTIDVLLTFKRIMLVVESRFVLEYYKQASNAF